MSTTDVNPTEDTDGYVDHDYHLSDSSAIKIFVFLAVVTGAEVALSYMIDDLGAFFLPLLLILMLVKFFTVVLYFMHLKFDSKLFSFMFYAGIVLALMVYVGTLLTFEFFN